MRAVGKGVKAAGLGLIVAAGLVCCLSGEAIAQTAILREGDPIGALGTATTVNIVNVNHGEGYAVGIITSSGPAAFWGSATGGAGAVLRSAAVYPPYTQGGV